MQEKKEKQSIVKIIKRNIWMLSFIRKYAVSLMLYKAYCIPISILNTFISINYARWIIDKISQQIELSAIIRFIIYIALFYIVTNLIYAISNIVWVPQKSINLTSRMREDIIKKVSKINQISFQKSEFFNTYTLGLNEIDSRAPAVLETVTSVIISALSIIMITGVTSTISNGFAIFGLISALTDVGLGLVRQKYNYNQVLETTPDGRKRGYVNRLTYQPEFTADLKVYTSFKHLLIAKYREATDRVKKILLKYAKKILLIDQIQQIVGTVCKQVLPWIYIAILLARGDITVAEATVLSASALTIPSTLITFLNSLSSFYWHSLYIENLQKILNYEEDIEKEDGEEIDHTVPFHISLKNISFSYAEGGKNAVEDISMEIQSGDKIAIVGYNGAGKSTLVKLLIRLYDIQSGQIMVNGKDMKDVNTKSLRSHIAFLSQEYKIYSLTVAENVLMRPVSCDEDLELVQEALRKVGLYDKVSSWSNGINTYITREFDEAGEYLSGGESQKLALARIYAGNYDCIIMDESTSSLDPISEDGIIGTIFEIFKDKTIIMISHRLVTVKYVDRIYFFSQGQLCEQGTHQELMELDGDYCKFYSSQADKFSL